MAQPQLSPDMAQPAMDQFLAAAFGVQTNPFSVKDIFESRKDAVAWGLLQRTLKLDDKQAHDLVLALRGAAASRTPAAPPRPKAAVSAATRNRIDDLAAATPGEHTSIFGRDEQRRPLDKDGQVAKQAGSWGSLLSGKQTAVTTKGGVAISTGAARGGRQNSGLSKDSKVGSKAQKAAEAAEKAALPPTTLRVTMPDSGWSFRKDIGWAYEHRAQIAAHLQAGLDEPEAVVLREGTDAAGKEYIEFSNLSDARKDKLSKDLKINFSPKSGGALAVLASISKAVEAAINQAVADAATAAEREALDSYKSVEEIDAAAVAEEGRIMQAFGAKREEITKKVMAVSKEMGESGGDVSRVLALTAQLAELQGELETLEPAEEKEKEKALNKFAELRGKLSTRVIDVATRQRRAPPAHLAGQVTSNGAARQRAKPGPHVQVALALERAKRKHAQMAAGSGSSPMDSAAPIAAPIATAPPVETAPSVDTALPVETAPPAETAPRV